MLMFLYTQAGHHTRGQAKFAELLEQQQDLEETLSTRQADITAAFCSQKADLQVREDEKTRFLHHYYAVLCRTKPMFLPSA